MRAPPRILFVPPRFSPALVGGAENLLRSLATDAQGAGCNVEIATTCATDNETWCNALPAGTRMEDGLTVRRFPVDRRDARNHQHLASELMRNGSLGELDAVDLMATSVWSSTLQNHLDAAGGGFDALVFAPYLFGTTFWGAQSWPERTILVPCLHDEPYAQLRPVQAMLRSVAQLAFNSRGEMALAQQLLGDVRGEVIGMGFDPPSNRAAPGFAAANGLGRYFVYAGRIEEGKRVQVAAECVAALARAGHPDVRLVVIGRGSWTPSAEVEPFVRMMGFLPEDEKRSALADAVALINPSELESLSIVLMEAWLEKTPALVTARSTVMSDHCAESDGGVPFHDERDFIAKATSMLEDGAAAAAMGERGREYVLRKYARNAVTQRFLALVETVRASNGS